MRFRSIAVALSPVLYLACVGDSPATPALDSGSDSTTSTDGGSDAATDSSRDATTVDADGGSTLPVKASLKLWFRGDVALAKSSNGLVWADQGPFMLDAVAAFDAGSGGYPSNKLNFFPNGMPAVVFEVDPQLLRLPDSPQFTDLSNGLSIFVAAIPTASKAGQWISFGASTSSNRVTLGQNGNVFVVALGATVHPASGSSGQVPVNEHHVFAATIRGTGGADSIAFYRDGQAAGTANGAALQNASRTLSTVGGSQSGSTITTAPVGLGEVLVYGKVVTPGERTDIEAYLKARFATP